MSKEYKNFSNLPAVDHPHQDVVCEEKNLGHRAKVDKFINFVIIKKKNVSSFHCFYS